MIRKQYLSKEEYDKYFYYNEETGELINKLNRPKSPVGTPAGFVVSPNTHTQYVMVRVKCEQYLAHRVIWIMKYGEIEKGKVIDHVDGNGLNNRIHNLRLVTQSVNCRNQHHLRKNNTSGHNGVSFIKKYKKWSATIKANGKCIFLGWFTDKEDAIEARKRAEIVYDYSANHGTI